MTESVFSGASGQYGVREGAQTPRLVHMAPNVQSGYSSLCTQAEGKAYSRVEIIVKTEEETEMFFIS